MLLHGDLHHGNIPSSTRDAWPIDPGPVGDASEVGALLRNPDSLLRSPSAGRILERRIARLSDELTLDRERVRNWAAAQAVLAAYWGWEDHGQIWQDALEYAELLWKIRA
ncbi:MAG: aminoglycoside phosphotransferase family protein [Chloroflexia bacterium]